MKKKIHELTPGKLYWLDETCGLGVKRPGWHMFLGPVIGAASGRWFAWLDPEGNKWSLPDDWPLSFTVKSKPSS
jgi:hypothetical protein